MKLLNRDQIDILALDKQLKATALANRVEILRQVRQSASSLW